MATCATGAGTATAVCQSRCQVRRGLPDSLAASDLIQASELEAKAPLAESLGVCVAMWTRMGFDVSEAVSQPCAVTVPLTAPSVPAATGSEDLADVLNAFARRMRL
jgi:hypothetical protein